MQNKGFARPTVQSAETKPKRNGSNLNASHNLKFLFGEMATSTITSTRYETIYRICHSEQSICESGLLDNHLSLLIF